MRSARALSAVVAAAALLSSQLCQAAVLGRAVPIENPSSAAIQPIVGSLNPGIGSGLAPGGSSAAPTLDSALPSLSALSPALRPDASARAPSAAVPAAKGAAAAPSAAVNLPPASFRAEAGASVAPAQAAQPAVSGRTASGETAHGAAAPGVMGTLATLSAHRSPSFVWDQSRTRTGVAPDPVFGPEVQGRASRTAALRPAVEGDAPEAGSVSEAQDFAWKPQPDELRGEAGVPQATWASRMRDRIDYLRKYSNSFYWRVSYRTTSKWGSVKADGQKTPREVRAVDHLMRFYVDHLLIGSIGRYGIFGLRVTDNATVLSDSRKIYGRYFREDPAARAAFERLLERAQDFNPHRPATQFRKVIQEGMLAAATMDIGKVPVFFDALAAPEAAAHLVEYQAAQMIPDLALFDRLAKDVIHEVNRHAQPGQRVLAALLMGSYAIGAAGTKSDLDLQVVTEDGQTRHLAEFYELLQERWDAAGKSQHEIGDFQYALPPSRGLIDSIHRAPYLIFSPYPEVIAGLQRSRAEDVRLKPADRRGWTGTVFHLFYAGLLFGAVLLYELRGRLSRKAA